MSAAAKSLTDAFNDLSASYLSANVLHVHNGAASYFYDFAQRVVTTGSGSAVAFSQMDREVLVAARDRLVALGGSPPDLPPEAPAAPVAPRKLNL